MAEQEIKPGVILSTQKDTATGSAANPADRRLWVSLKFAQSDDVQVQAVLADGTVVPLGRLIVDLPEGSEEQGQAGMFAQIAFRLVAGAGGTAFQNMMRVSKNPPVG